MTQLQQEESNILSIINMIVAKHGCHIEDIDIQNKLIDINGPEDKQVDCAIELSEVLKNYIC